MHKEKTGTVKSITRAISVLSAISLNLNRASDICKHTKLSSPTVYRLLQTLQNNGFVYYDDLMRRYYFGPLLAKFASSHITVNQFLINFARDKMEHLRRISGETVHLDISIGTERFKLLELTGFHSIVFAEKNSFEGRPIWSGSMGKVLLSMLPLNKMRKVLKKIQPFSLTPYTIVDKHILQKEISDIRIRGYATSINEATLGGCSISVPVYGYVQPISLSIIGPTERFGQKMIDYLNEMKKQAGIISDELSQNHKE